MTALRAAMRAGYVNRASRPVSDKELRGQLSNWGLLVNDADEKRIVNVMTTADVMARLKVSRKTLYALVAKHLPNAARVGREFRFIEADINKIWDGMRGGDGSYGRETRAARGGYIGAGHRGGQSETLRAMLTKKRRKKL